MKLFLSFVLLIGLAFSCFGQSRSFTDINVSGVATIGNLTNTTGAVTTLHVLGTNTCYAITIGGVTHIAWPTGGIPDPAGLSSNNVMTGVSNTFTGAVKINGTNTAYAINLGGVVNTAWPTGIPDPAGLASNNIFSALNTFQSGINLASSVISNGSLKTATIDTSTSALHGSWSVMNLNVSGMLTADTAFFRLVTNGTLFVTNIFTISSVNKQVGFILNDSTGVLSYSNTAAFDFSSQAITGVSNLVVSGAGINIGAGTLTTTNIHGVTTLNITTTNRVNIVINGNNIFAVGTNYICSPTFGTRHLYSINPDAPGIGAFATKRDIEGTMTNFYIQTRIVGNTWSNVATFFNDGSMRVGHLILGAGTGSSISNWTDTTVHQYGN